MDIGYRRIAGIILLILCLNFFVGFASADGIIIPRPIPDIQQIPPLSIKYHHVNVSIDNQYARTEIDQVFENEFHRDLEGTYIFPLPEDVSISEFSMFVENEKLEGKILEKEKAREIYEGIVRQLKDPALLEYAGRNTFTARVYPIPANGEKRIQLTYSEVVKCDNGICKYTYPLETEKFSSKPLKDVIISVKLSSKQAIKTIYSPTHKISIKRIGDYEAEVSYEENNVKPDKDFVLYWTISEDDFGVNLLTYKTAEEDGFFILMVAPKQEISKEEVLPKDIVFVLDTSGSMSGKKIEQAKNALKFIVNNLNEGDRFDIITFNTEIKKFDDGLMDANSENTRDALIFIDGIDARGGTNIHDAVIDSLKLFDTKGVEASRQSLELFEEKTTTTTIKPNCPQIQCKWDQCPGEHLPDAQGCINCASPCPTTTNSTKIIVFLTDGLPTVGVTETNRILGDVKSENKNNVKIFTFGVGYDVNTHLLDKISGQNSGASEYVEPDEDIEVKVSGFYSRISSPVLSDVKLDFNGLEVYDVYPKEIPDLFKGSQIVVFGRYSSTLNPLCNKKAKGIGFCRGFWEGYEFDQNLGKCVKTGASGCDAEIPFNTLEECQQNCENTGNELKFETIKNSNSVWWIGKEKNYVVLNQGDWRKSWGGAKDSIPYIDFEKDMAIAVSGNVLTGGYDLKIIKIIEDQDKIEVFIKETKPGRGCTVTQATETLLHIVKIQKSDKEIVFKTEKITAECLAKDPRIVDPSGVDKNSNKISDDLEAMILTGTYNRYGNTTQADLIIAFDQAPRNEDSQIIKELGGDVYDVWSSAIYAIHASLPVSNIGAYISKNSHVVLIEENSEVELHIDKSNSISSLPKDIITVKLTGKSLNNEKSYSYTLNFPKENLKNEFIPKLWASRKIGYLLDEIRLNGENKEIVDEIINLSLEYGIMTPYTSFLVDMDKDISRPAVREEARDMFNSIAAKSFSQTTGAGAVKTAQSMQEMQKSGISQDGSRRVKSIGTKTFYNRDGIWTDNEYAEGGQVTGLNYGSDEYFKFIAENPEFGKYLSIGKNVKFCSEGRCFEVRETGIEIPTTTIPVNTPTTTLPGITPIDKNQVLVQAIAIVGLLILISFGILMLSRRK